MIASSDGQREADADAPPRNGVALLADGKSQSQKRDDAESGLRLSIDPSGGNRPFIESKIDIEVKRRQRRRRTYPRPANGILVAITVMNSTFDSSPRLAM